MTYRERIHALLTPQEHHVLSPLSSSQRIQDYLDTLPINFEYARETCMSPRLVMRKKTAHCIEGAFLAAAAFLYHGRVPYLMDFQATLDDYDHVVTLFRERGKWGAVSKTNRAFLRYRDPIYKTPHELGMSYFNEYFLPDRGKKTLTCFSKPFSILRFDIASWVTTEEDLNWLAEALDNAPHFPSPAKNICLRPVSYTERRAMGLVDWRVRTSRYRRRRASEI
ncbi:hypothetical protein A2673_00880 [Candidatus Kaiserbacteria bacterium RIFCSPHIGHO2_01_FULL_50_13]|uniref:Transglutaminase-like domain-containing protein n=1 Tax=Candidatus Kaiserbacteria bacterium RIFCSPLOWO2_01_FULL_50_24 TaxID=1798507 RepID=A0A1F6EMU4_9BACT|nr:MAG: hypothetical protein A2673_00880 [Candidatus Kaiserbacteria bacterium RIFCSPHIGHO2_01_FULL_50_13]OGG74968.1 MAG: hypothetical protein A3A34_04085 [Candidatus Kaiserbacteria bacterium RIFCSPLOWO2_01_FULL_50_24]OGG81770.1 MAG: hypothetical protein A3H74_01160 [Candidatus Kaiserbacteria bacterium RIFCSPLOWO2_02_FULL_51_13]